MLRLNRATQTDNVGSGISASHAFPARVFSPVFSRAAICCSRVSAMEINLVA
ncbi:hypothetical protein C4K08_4028 [Pseudomonas chlororaphis subsp. aureofaciens]|nr:hypothetical protein C4K08_4028 [Pseudomonas chlororaphis subsp. aureofaciens]